MNNDHEPGKINVSEPSKKLLEGQFEFKKRPSMIIKGKGEMNTFFLISDAINQSYR